MALLYSDYESPRPPLPAQAINKLDGTEFTAEDIRTLSVVADTAGVTLHKARLLQDANTAKAATEALAAVVRVVNDASAEGDIEALAGRLVDIAVDLIDGMCPGAERGAG